MAADSKPPPSGGSAGGEPPSKSSSQLSYKPLSPKAQREPSEFIRWFGQHWGLWSREQREAFARACLRGPDHAIAFTRRLHRQYAEGTDA